MPHWTTNLRKRHGIFLKTKITKNEKRCFTFCFTLLSLGAFAQAKTIKLNNPSFEDYVQAGHAPEGWYDCGFGGETPPDVGPTGLFKETQKANTGATYLGLVTRDNKTWEAVGQKLKSPLLSDTCYELTIYLMSSSIYMSRSRLTKEDVNYNSPAKLAIYGGYTICEQRQLLAESPTLKSKQWTKYSFIIKPEKKLDYLILMSYYADEMLDKPIGVPTNGNVLVDNISDITPCSCTKSEEKK